MIDNLLEIKPGFRRRLLKFLTQAEVDQIVEQVRPHEKFGRKVTHNPVLAFANGCSGIDEQVLHSIAKGVAHRQIIVVQRCI